MPAYDPGFHTMCSLTSDPVLTGRQGCTAETFVADASDERDRQLQPALAEDGEDGDSGVQFPAIGAAYADEIRASRANPSGSCFTASFLTPPWSLSPRLSDRRRGMWGDPTCLLRPAACP